MEELPSPLLKSRIPRKTIIVDANLFTDDIKSRIYDLHCPLRKGIIYYRQDGAIFEYNIHSSSKHEPRIIVPKHRRWRLAEVSFIPIKGNRILLFAKYSGRFYLYLSIHEIRSDHGVGPALWSFNGNIDGHCDTDAFSTVTSMVTVMPIQSTENALGITFGMQFDNHWKLFDISTTNTGSWANDPLIESGRINFDLKLKSKWMHKNSSVILSPDRRILLNVDSEQGRHNETIDIHYSDSGSANNMNFSFISRMSIPIPRFPEDSLIDLQTPVIAFSADGSKFAMAMGCGGVSVWDIRSKLPLKTFMEVSRSNYHDRFVPYLQFSSGKSGKEALAFVEYDGFSFPETIHVIDATSFEIEEILLSKLEGLGKPRSIEVGVLFFDPSGGVLYTEINGTLYEWDLQKNKRGPEWWIGEE